MNTKIIICLVIAALLSTASFAEVQQLVKVFRIGYLSTLNSVSEFFCSEVIRLVLCERGYIEG